CDLTLMDQHEHRDALHLKALGHHGALVDVDLNDFQLPAQLARHLLDDGRQLFAGCTPVSVEVHQDWQLAGEHLALERCVVDLDHRHVSLLAAQYADEPVPPLTMATLALAPMRLAPALTMASTPAASRTPPDAFTPSSSPTTARIRATSSTVAPPGPN